MMATISLTNAVWVDVNTNYTQNVLPDRLPDAYAIIYASLTNLLGCPIGGRSRTFQPTYGSSWLGYIHEPISQNTADLMQITMLDAVRIWETRIKLYLPGTYIIPDFGIPGYKVGIAFYLAQGASTLNKMQFNVKV